MKRERATWLPFLLLLAFLLAGTAMLLAYPLCWTDPGAVSSGPGGKWGVLALFDQAKECLHVSWYDADDATIYHCAYRPDSVGYDCGVEEVVETAIGSFGAAVDSSSHLHFVWAAPSEIGPSGETSNLFYKETEECPLGAEAIENITPAYNVPGDEDTLSEDFESGLMPEGWGTAGTAPGGSPWGEWTVDDNLGQDTSYALVGRRLLPQTEAGWFYSVLPPVLIDEGDSAEFSFWYKIERSGTSDSAGVRLRGLSGFPMRTWKHFAEEQYCASQFILWEGTLKNTEFDSVKVAFPDSLEGKFLHVAFELYAASDTSVRVCIDNICTGVASSLKPEIPTMPAHCSEPVLAADCDGNIHVAFTRIAWQPNACICRDQVYYARYDADSSAWCEPFQVDSSGVDCKGCDPAIAVSHDKTVHVAWTDEGRMKILPSCADDVFYISRPGDAATPSWDGSAFEVLSDDGWQQGCPGCPDTSACLEPDLAVGPAGDLVAVFHGGRYVEEHIGPHDPPRLLPDSFMRIWMRTKTAGGGWSEYCTPVPDSLHLTESTYYNVDSLDCRCPVIDVDSNGNMYVAYTWNRTTGTPGLGDPEALALAQYYAPDEAWRPSAGVMRDLQDTVSVERWLAIRLGHDGAGYLFWCEGNTAGTHSALMNSTSTSIWESCGDGPPGIAMTVDRFTRGLCPSDDDSLDADEKRAFEILLTVKDEEGIPLPGFPPDSLYVAVIGDTAAPPDTCALLNGVGFGRQDSTYRFWCGGSDAIFATDTTGIQGTLITVKNVSGRARLRLQAHYGDTPVGEEDTVWINSVDQVPTVPNGKVAGPDFMSFGAAYNDWRLRGLGNWAWDLLHEPADVCTTGVEVKFIFDVDQQDFSWFGAHYPDTLATDDCED